MGDSVAELQSDSLRIRFIRDKSRIHVELASLSEPERWLELGFLRRSNSWSEGEKKIAKFLLVTVQQSP